MTMAVALHFQIDQKCVQRIVPSNDSERFEGVDFSRSGDVLAVATSESNSVLLFRRKPTGRFEDTPFRTIGRSPNWLDYPHDVSFSRSRGTELLAVAQRAGAILIYEKNGSDGSYGSAPTFESVAPNQNSPTQTELPSSRRTTITWRRAIWNRERSCFFAGFRSHLLHSKRPPSLSSSIRASSIPMAWRFRLAVTG